MATNQSKTVNFEKARKRRQRANRLKGFMIAGGITLLIGMALAINNIMVEESVTTQIGDIISSFGGTGFPVALPGGVIRNVTNMGGYLAVLNDTNLYIYNSEGKIISNIQKMNDQTVAIPSNTHVLAFSVGNKAFSVQSRSKELFAKTLPYGVMTGDMNKRGDFAIVAPTKQFASKVTAYTSRCNEVYSWSTPEYVTHVAMSPKGESMAVTCVSATDGVLESLVYLFRFSEDREQAEVAQVLSDQMVLKLLYAQEDRIQILTDRACMILDQKGKERYRYDLAGTQVLAVETGDRKTLLLTQEREGKAQKIALLDQNLAEKAALSQDEKILDMALGRDSIYLLTQDGIIRYNQNFEEKARLEMRNITEVHLIDNVLYYLSPEEICIFNSKEPQKN